jgi:succinyl-CoA synthetase beta subunit
MKPLNEYQAKQLLRKNGILIPRGTIVNNRLEARNVAASIGTGSVLKLVSPDVVHKSDGGFVVLNVEYHNAPTVYDELISKASKIGAKVTGVLVEEMLSGYEVFVGLKRDPQFGQIVIAGMGGIYLEVYKDIVSRVAPVTLTEAHEMLKELKGYKILTGIRGKEKANSEEIADVIMKVSNMKGIVELDINPLMVDSISAIAADSRMIIEE